MSRILRDQAPGPAFIDTLQGAKSVREALIRRTGKNMTPLDARREAARKEGYDIGRQEGFATGRAESYAASKAEYDALNATQCQKFAQGLAVLAPAA